MSASLLRPEKGTWVLLSFIAFFAVIVSVNTVFITSALNTHSGVVTKQPYEKGLAYNAYLEKAQSQPVLTQRSEFKNGTLRWILSDAGGKPLQAEVSALLIRPIKDGHDFQTPLKQISPGVYAVPLDLPMKGRWEAQLTARWNNLQYQTRLSFTAK